MRIVLLSITVLFLSSCALPKQFRNISSFVSDDEQSVIKYVRQGNDYYRRGRYIDAEIAYLTALSIEPKANNIIVNLINTLIKTNQLERAEANFRTIKGDLKKGESYLLQSKLSYAKGNYRAALDQKIKALPYLDDSLELSELHNSISGLAYLVGDEQLSLCQASEAYGYVPDVNNKIKLLRLYSSVGYSEVPESFAKVKNLKSESDAFKWIAAIFLANSSEENIEHAKEIFAQQKLARNSESPELTYIKNKVLRDPDSALNLIDPIFISNLNILKPNGTVKPELALYWPAHLLDSLIEE